jgi:hypothetical protein
MSRAIKLNVMLALTETLGKHFNASVKEYGQYFKSNEKDFKGLKKTYTPQEGTMDSPSERGNLLVVTTVDEKLDYFEKQHAKYIDALFAQEKTNASGVCKAELVVEGVSWGEFSSLELLRIKSLLENSDIRTMYERLPIISDNEEWRATTSEMYTGRNIFEQEVVRTEKKTTTKESYILPDPNLEKKTSLDRYVPSIATKDTVVKLGDATLQVFSGATTAKRRASILARLATLHVAVVEALKVANEAEVQKSELTAEKLFNYLHRG